MLAVLLFSLLSATCPFASATTPIQYDPEAALVGRLIAAFSLKKAPFCKASTVTTESSVSDALIVLSVER